jgi:hypothetical protein
MIVKLLVAIPAIAAGFIAAGLLALIQGGIATVYVHDEDVKVFLPVPMAAVDIAIAFAPDEELAELRRTLAPHRDLIRAALAELAACPDAVLVDIQSPGESVLISKVGDEIRVRVEEYGSTEVDVRVPLRSVLRISSALAG